MKRLLRGAIVLVLVAIIPPSPLDVQAQGAPETTTFWLSAGIGMSQAGSGPETETGGGAALRAALSIQDEAFVFTTRWTLNTGGSHPSGGGFSGPTSDQFYDIGLLGGYSFNPESDWQGILSAGVGIVGGERVVSTGSSGTGGGCIGFYAPSRTVRDESIGTTFGVPIELGLYGNKGNFAVAVIAHMNLNREAIFGGVTLNVMTGVLKS